MTLDATLSEQAALAAPRAADPRIVRAERMFCMVRGLRLIAMWMCEALTRHANPAKYDGRPWSGPRIVLPLAFEPFGAFARAFRAARLALMLEARIHDEIAEMRAGRFPSWAAPAPTAPRSKGGAEAAPPPRNIPNVDHEALAGSIEPPERKQGLLAALNTPFLEDPSFYKLLYGPVEDAVAAICADLGLKPDWSQWTEDGFPPPPGDDVQNWTVFFAPEGEARSRTGPEVEAPVWRPRWSRSRSFKRPPPVSGDATKRWEMGKPP
jgi:hypothetical protein